MEQFVLPEPNRSRVEETTDILRGVLTGRQCDPNANVRYSAYIALEKLGTDVAQHIVNETYIIPPDVLIHQKPYTFTARGKEFQINGSGMPVNMVFVAGGSFTMRDRGEKVTVNDFFMSIFPVTNREYRRFFENDGYNKKQFWSKEGWKQKQQDGWKQPRLWSDDRFNHDWQPVVGISWYEAEAYCTWLTEFSKAKKPFRLPSEEEWEHAARGPAGDAWAFEGDWNEHAPRWDSYFDYEQGLTYGTSRVNSVYNEAVSGFGIFDMSGNVWEWTDSWFDKENKYRVLRGGSWASANEDDLRAASRHSDAPGDRERQQGVSLSPGLSVGFERFYPFTLE